VRRHEENGEIGECSKIGTGEKRARKTSDWTKGGDKEGTRRMHIDDDGSKDRKKNLWAGRGESTKQLFSAGWN